MNEPSMLELLKTRRSVREFKTDPVDEQDIQDILEAAMNAPSAVNEQSWQFVVLSGTMLKEFCAINTNTPKGAAVGILVCQDLKAEKAKGYAVQDCSAATQNILLAVHAKGLGGVWTTVFSQNADRIRALLAIPEGIQPFSFVPIGYPARKPANMKNGFDKKKIHKNTW